MIKRLAMLCLGLLYSTGLSAQEPFNIAVRVDKLATLLTQLYGRDGLVVDSRATLPSGDDHSAHFNSAFQTEFARVRRSPYGQAGVGAAPVSRVLPHLRVSTPPWGCSAEAPGVSVRSWRSGQKPSVPTARLSGSLSSIRGSTR